MEGTIGEIRYFAGNFAPKNWAFCSGQIIPIQQNTAFFSILGTTYGGNGQTTFGLPDFRGRVAVGNGSGPGLTPRVLGETGGVESVTLLPGNIPAHTHPISGSVTMNATTTAGNADSPQNTYPAVLAGEEQYASSPDGNTMGAMQHTITATGYTGSQLPLNNIQPVLGMNFIICMFGVFPARN